MLSNILITVLGPWIFAGLITAAEIITPVERVSLKARLRGFIFLALNMALGTLLLVVVIPSWQALGVRPLVEIQTTWLAVSVGIALSILLHDFTGYWFHRLMHSRWLWPIHAVHHSQTELCAATNYSHFSDKVVSYCVLGLGFSLIRIDLPAVPFAVAAARELLEFYIHSSTSAHLGPMRRLLVDNRFHRIHHSLEPQHFDKNFATVFSIWDRIFGTAWEPREGEWPSTGIAGHPPPRSAFDYILYPLIYWRRNSSGHAGYGAGATRMIAPKSSVPTTDNEVGSLV